MQLKTGPEESKGGLAETLRARGEFYEQAIEVIVREGRGSVSLWQRARGIGYGRAARLVDFLAEDGPQQIKQQRGDQRLRIFARFDLKAILFTTS